MQENTHVPNEVKGIGWKKKYIDQNPDENIFQTSIYIESYILYIWMIQQKSIALVLVINQVNITSSVTCIRKNRK